MDAEDTKETRVDRELLDRQERMSNILLEAEDEFDTDTAEQLRQMLGALDIFLDRRPRYGDAWRAHGALANLLTAARKVDRLMEEWWHGNLNPADTDKALDDAYDLINYAVFFIRLAKEGNYRGKPRT